MNAADYFGFVIFFGWISLLFINKVYKSEMPTAMKAALSVGAIIGAHYMVKACVIVFSPQYEAVKYHMASRGFPKKTFWSADTITVVGPIFSGMSQTYF